jgi:hypothetical protein
MNHSFLSPRLGIIRTAFASEHSRFDGLRNFESEEFPMNLDFVYSASLTIHRICGPNSGGIMPSKWERKPYEYRLFTNYSALLFTRHNNHYAEFGIMVISIGESHFIAK